MQTFPNPKPENGNIKFKKLIIQADSFAISFILKVTRSTNLFKLFFVPSMVGRYVEFVHNFFVGM